MQHIQARSAGWFALLGGLWVLRTNLGFRVEGLGFRVTSHLLRGLRGRLSRGKSWGCKYPEPPSEHRILITINSEGI